MPEQTRSNEDALADPEKFGVDPVPVDELIRTYEMHGLPAPAHLIPLLVAITRCPIVDLCRQPGNEGHDCHKIVSDQDGRPFQVPEPWSGHIAQAPILFVSSNPSIDPEEEYPTVDWEDDRRVDFFDGRFDQRREPWVNERLHARRKESPPYNARATRFWIAARARASELLGKPHTVPGRDFALTEVVHCKSEGEEGVDKALKTCVDTWLRKVVHASGARVIVLFGKHAAVAFEETYGIVPKTPLSGPVMIEDRSRIVLQLPHPNARQARTDCAPLKPAELAFVRRHLTGG